MSPINIYRDTRKKSDNIFSFPRNWLQNHSFVNTTTQGTHSFCLVVRWFFPLMSDKAYWILKQNQVCHNYLILNEHVKHCGNMTSRLDDQETSICEMTDNSASHVNQGSLKRVEA